MYPEIMTKKDIVRAVGRARYRKACRIAREDSGQPDYGSARSGRSGPATDVPEQIAGFLWYGDRLQPPPDEIAERYGVMSEPAQPRAEAVDLLFEVYDDMPAYGHLMELVHVYRDLTPEERTRLHRHYRDRLLLDDPAIRQPVQYSLWCDFFESPDTVGEWWPALAGPGAPEAVLRRVLPLSGPVPWELKRPVYDNLLPAKRWHEPIFESLFQSAFEIFGKIDRQEARRILGRLRLPAGIEGREVLEERLEPDGGV